MSERFSFLLEGRLRNFSEVATYLRNYVRRYTPHVEAAIDQWALELVDSDDIDEAEIQLRNRFFAALLRESPETPDAMAFAICYGFVALVVDRVAEMRVTGSGRA